MSQSKIKLYKNSERAKTEVYKPYVPQYQQMGLEPEEFKSPTLTAPVMVAASNVDNPRVRKVGLRQPYAEVSQSPIGRGRGPIPNVGNNMEQTWSSIDGDIVDDLDQNINSSSYIDNNDYVTETALGQSTNINKNKQHVPPAKPINTSKASEDLESIVQDLSEGAYLLIVNGVAICSGPLEEIQEQARAIVFGEHELCDGSPIPADHLLILKRISIKMGLFLE